MNLSFAWRNIWRNRLRSLIIIASVAIGLFSGIFVLGIYEGMMKTRIRTVIDTEVGHLQIHHPKFKDDYDPVFTISEIEKLKKALHGLSQIKCMAFRSITQGMLSTSTSSAGVQINGVIQKDENIASQLNVKIKEGMALNPEKKNAILIGWNLANKMKLKVGSKLVLTFIDSESNITSGAFRVTGIYRTDNTPLDEQNVYVHQTTLNNYLATSNASHEIVLLLHNNSEVEAVQQKLHNQFPKYSIKTWRENSPESDLMVSTINQYSFIIMVIIMIALAFGIINTMLMSVLERTREIGMLTALGMNRLRVFLLILTETVLLTLIGVPIGLLISWIVIKYFGTAGIDISTYSETAMSSFGFNSIIYPEFPINMIVNVMIIVISTALLAALFPSIKAIKLQPADALRQ